jgi:hypothetical protein
MEVAVVEAAAEQRPTTAPTPVLAEKAAMATQS